MIDESFWLILFRWFHFLAGITWIGLLYYLNLINVRFVPAIDAAVRPQIVPLNLARVLAWFRHSAWVTVLMGLLIVYMKYWRTGDYPGGVSSSDAGNTIFIGGLLGILMAINVWAIIWPNQKRIIAAMRAGTGPDPMW